VDQHFRANGCMVAAVSRDERGIPDYIRNHEKEDERLCQLNLWKNRQLAGGQNQQGPH